VTAVDSNILVYAHRRDSAFHKPAHESLRSLAEGQASWAIPWPCLYEFYAVVTHPRIYAPPTTPAAARAQIGAWLASPSLLLLHEGEGFWETLEPVLSSSSVAGAAVHDARIAALCLRHGIKTLLSADRDFSRFPSLSLTNPVHG